MVSNLHHRGRILTHFPWGVVRVWRQTLKHIVTSKWSCHGTSTNWTWLQSRICLRRLEAEHGHFPIWKLMVHTKIHSQLVDFGGVNERVCPLIKIQHLPKTHRFTWTLLLAHLVRARCWYQQGCRFNLCTGHSFNDPCGSLQTQNILWFCDPILIAKRLKDTTVHTEQVLPLPLWQSPTMQDYGILWCLLRGKHFCCAIIYSNWEARDLQYPSSNKLVWCLTFHCRTAVLPTAQVGLLKS